MKIMLLWLYFLKDDGRMKVMIEIQETWPEKGLDCKRSGGIPGMVSVEDQARDLLRWHRFQLR